MSEQSEKWGSQWSKLLTHCHGAEVEANADFKATLLAKLKKKAAECHGSGSPENDVVNEDNWQRLLTAAYVPCEPNAEFKETLFSQLKARQTQLTKRERTPSEDEALQTILTKSYHPVTPRREFQTRLLENLKERQRTNTTIRTKTRRRTFIFSGMASMAAAAMVMFAVWVMPTMQSATRQESTTNPIVLTIPTSESASDLATTEFASTTAYADVLPASYEPSAPAFEFNVLDAFAAAALPAKALARKNIEVDTGSGWQAMGEGYAAEIQPGMAFRTTEGNIGFIGFDDDTILSMNPGTIVDVTENGLAIRQGLAQVLVPEKADKPFRLHFPERDIAIEPGTELAAYVENGDAFAEGGAPAPVVLILQESDAVGGLAYAKGKNGVAPLFARHIYRLDNYVTQDIPGRSLCEIECAKIENISRDGIVPEANNRMAAFVGLASVPPTRSRTIAPPGFTRRSDRWIADGYTNQPTIKIQYLSDAYFGLVKERRDLATGLALGANVVIDAGNGTFYEIYR